MSLTDLMSSFGLAIYPIVALVIFLGVFAAVMVRLYRTPNRELRAWAESALDDRPAAVLPSTSESGEPRHA